MALTTTQITSGSGINFFAVQNQKYFTIQVPAGQPSINLSLDAQGQIPIGTAVAGTPFQFAGYNGFYYSSNGVSGASVIATGIKVFSSNGAGTVVTNVTAETYTNQLVLPANVLFAGAILKIRYQVAVTGVTGSPTLQPILRFGGAGTSADTALITSTAVTATTSTVASGEFELNIRAAPGATVAIAGVGTFANIGAVATPTTIDAATLAPTNFATNAILYVSLGLVWSAASTSNIAASNYFEAELF